VYTIEGVGGVATPAVMEMAGVELVYIIEGVGGVVIPAVMEAAEVVLAYAIGGDLGDAESLSIDI